jgi:hypothetical protein
VSGTIYLECKESVNKRCLTPFFDDKSVEAQPLDAVGRPLGPAISAQKSGDGWSLPVGNPATTWYLLRVTR